MGQYRSVDQVVNRVRVGNDVRQSPQAGVKPRLQRHDCDSDLQIICSLEKETLSCQKFLFLSGVEVCHEG